MTRNIDNSELKLTKLFGEDERYYFVDNRHIAKDSSSMASFLIEDGKLKSAFGDYHYINSSLYHSLLLSLIII